MLVLSALATFSATVLLASASPVEPATPLLRVVDLHAGTDAAALCKPCADVQATTKACVAIAGKDAATFTSCICTESYFLKASSCVGCLSVSDPKLYNQTQDFAVELGTFCTKTGNSDPNTYIVPGVMASAQASGAALGTPPSSGGTGRILATSILGTALVVLMAGGAVLL